MQVKNINFAVKKINKNEEDYLQHQILSKFC